MRAVFGQIIAEKNRLKAENRILKQNTEVILDMRPNQLINVKQAQQEVQIVPALNGILVKSEIEALEDAINEENMANRGWTISKYGAVKDENNRPLFKTGFVSAIKKVLLQL